jgi:hypothetical protein
MIQKTIRNSELTPIGYRVAWYDYHRCRGVCYPIGIHLLAWAVWRLLEAMFRPLPESERTKLEGEIAGLKQRNRNLSIEVEQWREQHTAMMKEVRAVQRGEKP